MADATATRVLVVTSEGASASTVAAALEEDDRRFEVYEATPEAALERLSEFDADCVVSDRAGLSKPLSAARPDLPVVAVSVDGTAPEADGASTLASRVEAAVRRGGPLDREWFRELLDATSDVVAVLDDDGTVEYVNGTVRQVLGYDPSELLGRDAVELVHEDDRGAAGELFARLAEADDVEFPSVKSRVRHADGRWRHVEIEGRTRLESGPLDGNVVRIAEITGRRERRQELARYETIVETTPVGMFVLDEDGVITWANDVYAETLDLPRAEIEGTRFTDLIEAGYYDPAVTEQYLEHVRTLLSSENDVEESTYTVETNRRNDERRIYEAVVTLLPREDGEFSGTVIAFRDVTKQREYEAELERQNRRLDRFASTVSHDLRNPLTVARGRTRLARETGELEHLEAVEDAHDRMETLIERLLALARDEGLEEVREVDLADAAAAAWRSVADDDAELDVFDGGTVEADPNRLGQLFENLFRNALEHGAPEGRPVTVTAGTLEDREGFFVEDDGRGIPPEERDRVFEHGYSTADDGTGLGLDIVRTVVEDHGWSVSLTENGSGGARFEVETGDADG